MGPSAGTWFKIWVSDPLDRAIVRLAHWQVRWALPIALGGVVLLAFGVALASRLELRTRFDQMLPDDNPSVTEFRRVLDRVGTNTKVSVVLEAQGATTKEELRAFGDALVPRLEAIGKPLVVNVANGTQKARTFLAARAGLFADRAALEKLDEDLEQRMNWEVGKVMDLNLEDEPPAITYESLAKRFNLEHERERFPDGYYSSQDGKALVVLVQTSVAPGDLEHSREVYDRVRATVDKAKAELNPPAARITYAGDVVTALAEYGAVREDLFEVGVLGVSMVLAVVLLFFMRLRALTALGFTVACGVAWTFGATYLVIGHLNVATGFLFSIIAGNGINFGILYMARYFEERRAGNGPEDALRIAHERTDPSTLTVALASAAAYGSLGASGFRVFRHFAVIGSIGMGMCWIATATLLPAVLLLLERLSPFRGGDTSLWHRLRWRGLRYDSLFGYLVQRAPRMLAFGGLALTAVGMAAIVVYLRADRMEYDVRKMHSDLGSTSDIYHASRVTEQLIGGKLDNGMVLLAHRLDQVAALKKALMERRDQAPADQKPFEAVHTLLDFVPDAQAEKIPALLSIRSRLLRAKKWMDPADWQKIEVVLPPEDLKPFTLADLPDDLARPFSEKDGTRGRVALIEPTAGVPDTDIHYLIRWADSFRETRLPNGEVLRGSGRAVIFADMIGAVQRDVPVAVGLSLGMTLLVVVLLFRNLRRSSLVLGALFVGLSWMALFMVVTNVKINFFNFVALPITFGIGVDYAVNFVRRCESDPEGGVLGALKHTGGPIVLCSLTTICGYSALIASINQAIRGLGVLAVVGEITCLFAALLVLPAVMLLIMKGRRSLTPVAIQSEPSS